MDESELLVHEYLKFRGFKDIAFEPIANETPDFVYESSHAFEVRRLNRNYFVDESSEGYEKTRIPIHKAIRNQLAEYKNPNKKECWIVSISFKRPVDWKNIKKKVRKAIEEFVNSDSKGEGVLYCSADESLSLSAHATTEIYDQLLVPGGIDDQDSGGWLFEDMEINIDHCIREKTKKISKNKSKYPSWNLVLVDYIGYGLDEFDQSLFHDQVRLIHDWDSVVLINPRDPTKWFQV